MKKVLTLSSPPFSKQQLDDLKNAFFPDDENNAKCSEWSLKDDGSLDLYIEEN